MEQTHSAVILSCSYKWMCWVFLSDAACIIWMYS